MNLQSPFVPACRMLPTIAQGSDAADERAEQQARLARIECECPCSKGILTVKKQVKYTLTLDG